MLRVAALTGGRHAPAARFRVRQHRGPLRQLGVAVSEHVPLVDAYRGLPGADGEGPAPPRPLAAAWQAAKLAARAPGIAGSRRADLTWLGRELVPGFRTLEGLLGRPLVFDVDDAVWLLRERAPERVAAIGRTADLVIAGNEYLAGWFRERGAEAEVVPTAVDTERFRPLPGASDSEGGDWVVGWTGSRDNLRYLYAVEKALARVARRVPAMRLRVVCDARPRFSRFPPERVEYVRWSPGREAEAVRRMDVGLMPLADSEWARGKCAFKMLQYMACGVPVVVSPVGMNREVLEMGEVGHGPQGPEEWTDALRDLREDPEKAAAMGRRGRSVAVRRFSRARISRRLAELFRSLAAR